MPEIHNPIDSRILCAPSQFHRQALARIKQTVMDKYSPQLLDTLLKRANDIISGDDYIHWAIAALEQGLDTPNLRILASLPASTWRSDAEPYFNRAVDELHIHIGSDEEILREYAN